MILRESYYIALFAYLDTLEDFVAHFDHRELPPIVEAKRMRVLDAQRAFCDADQQ